ncbi:MAG: phosphate signaling complex protein PhoU [Burkholderiales bacterium]|nr:phosphate signaling complex protein PhoU [Burkholderiales bacterium]
MHKEHSSKRYDTQLEALRTRVLQMGGLVEAQIVDAIDALLSGNLDLARKVIATDSEVDALEVSIDEDCGQIIVRRQPAASDLRMVLTVAKAITDLERIGDEAEKIARMALLIYSSGVLFRVGFSDIKIASNLAMEMLRRALDGFLRLDAEQAADVLNKDADLDDQFRSILRQLITYMMEDPRTISVSIETLFVAKALERIGDHAKNVAEHVIYLVKGQDVRHVAAPQIETEARG